MYAYYLDKGHTLESLINLSILEKLFYAEAMCYNVDIEAKKWGGN